MFGCSVGVRAVVKQEGHGCAMTCAKPGQQHDRQPPNPAAHVPITANVYCRVCMSRNPQQQRIAARITRASTVMAAAGSAHGAHQLAGFGGRGKRRQPTRVVDEVNVGATFD